MPFTDAWWPPSRATGTAGTLAANIHVQHNCKTVSLLFWNVPNVENHSMWGSSENCRQIVGVLETTTPDSEEQCSRAVSNENNHSYLHVPRHTQQW